MNMILCVVLGVVVVLAAGVFLIPNKYELTKTYMLDATVAEVWAVYTDYEGQVDWRESVVRVEMHDGGGWTEYTQPGDVAIDFTIREEVKHQGTVLDYTVGKFARGTYTSKFESVGGKTRATLSEQGHSLSVFAKVMRFIFFNDEKFMDNMVAEANEEILRRRDGS